MGRLHLERVAPGDVPRLYTRPPPSGFDDLAVYLKHLGNADRMMGCSGSAWSNRRVMHGFAGMATMSPFCRAFTKRRASRTGAPIISSGAKDGPRRPPARNLKVEDLGVLFLEQAGLLIMPPMNLDNQTPV